MIVISYKNKTTICSIYLNKIVVGFPVYEQNPSKFSPGGGI